MRIYIEHFGQSNSGVRPVEFLISTYRNQDFGTIDLRLPFTTKLTL